jgi:hypothetical protein
MILNDGHLSTGGSAKSLEKLHALRVAVDGQDHRELVKVPGNQQKEVHVHWGERCLGARVGRLRQTTARSLADAQDALLARVSQREPASDASAERETRSMTRSA